MDVTTIKRMIGQCDDLKEIGIVETAIKERRTLIHKRLQEKAEADAWARVKNLKNGDTLYCCADGIFLGGTIQRGTVLTVYTVQPRAKRLWVTQQNVDHPLWFKPAAIARYNLQTTPPTRPISPGELSVAKAVTEAISDIERRG
jgi:hypothetical protein